MIMSLLKKIGRLFSNVYAIAAFLGFAILLFIKHQAKRLIVAKEQLRIQEFVNEEKDLIIKDQQKTMTKDEEVKEFYDDLRIKLHDFTE